MRIFAKRIAFAVDVLARRPRVAALVHPDVLLLLAASMAFGTCPPPAPDAGLEPALLVGAPCIAP